MKLLDEIIASATGNSEPIANLLRKCLVLAHDLKNDRLATWAKKELNGYDADDPLPSYRSIRTVSKGLFIGGALALNDQPLPPSILKAEHRDWGTKANLTQPIAAYEGFSETAQLPWPPELTAHYQHSFIEGYTLNRAWQEIPLGALVGLIDSVRNRILGFALEIRDELGTVSDKPEELQPAKVDQYVINNIYGGHNVIGSSARSITQSGNSAVAGGDIIGLKRALREFGVDDADTKELEQALEADKKDGESSLGQRTLGWIKKVGSKLGATGMKVSGDVSSSVLTKIILNYLGIPS